MFYNKRYNVYGGGNLLVINIYYSTQQFDDRQMNILSEKKLFYSSCNVRLFFLMTYKLQVFAVYTFDLKEKKCRF